jgi:general stress protein 26
MKETDEEMKARLKSIWDDRYNSWFKQKQSDEETMLRKMYPKEFVDIWFG